MSLSRKSAKWLVEHGADLSICDYCEYGYGYDELSPDACPWLKAVKKYPQKIYDKQNKVNYEQDEFWKYLLSLGCITKDLNGKNNLTITDCNYYVAK